MNFGNVPEISAVSWTKSAEEYQLRSLIQFDLGAVPSHATIQSAELSLYWAAGCEEGNHYGFFGSNGAYLSRITSPWEEQQVTWEMQPSTTSLHKIIIAGTKNATQSKPDIDVTQLVKDMVVDPGQNFGFMLSMQVEAPYKKMVFASSDNSQASLRPKLVISYTVPAVEPAAESLSRITGEESVLEIFPNPAKEKVSIRINSLNDDLAYISIYDLAGREMSDQAYQLTIGKNQFSFETAAWKRGYYVVIVKTGGDMIREKLLLE